MPLSYQTDNPDSLEVLLNKANALNSVNKESLEYIHSRKGQQVITNYYYTLQSTSRNAKAKAKANKTRHRKKRKREQKRKLTANKNNDIDIFNDDEDEDDEESESSMNDSNTDIDTDNVHDTDNDNDNDNDNDKYNELFALKPHRSTENINDIIDSWRYNGEGLTREKIAIDNFIDLRLERFEDLVRIQKDLDSLLEAYTRILADVKESRVAVEVVLRNIEVLQVAIGQIHEQTIDSVDTVDDDDEVKKGMKYLAKGLERLRSRIPRLQFDLGGLKVESSEEDRVVEFTDFGSLTIKDTLSTRRGCVYSLEPYFMNGKHYLASPREKTVKLWDLSNTMVAATLTGHKSTVRALTAYIKDGVQMLASGSYDCTIKLWDLRTNTNVQTLTGHTYIVSSLLVFEKDKKMYLASGSFDCTIKIWDLDLDENNHNPITTFQEHEWCDRALELYHDNVDNKPYLASSSYHGSIKIWCLEDFSLLTTLRNSDCRVYSLLVVNVNVNQDDKKILVSGDGYGDIKLWNLEIHACIGTIHAHSGAIKSLEVLECNGVVCLATSGDDKCIKVWDLESHTCMNTICTDVDIMTMRVFMHGDRACLATGDGNGDVKLWME